MTWVRPCPTTTMSRSSPARPLAARSTWPISGSPAAGWRTFGVEAERNRLPNPAARTTTAILFGGGIRLAYGIGEGVSATPALLRRDESDVYLKSQNLPCCHYTTPETSQSLVCRAPHGTADVQSLATFRGGDSAAAMPR